LQLALPACDSAWTRPDRHVPSSPGTLSLDVSAFGPFESGTFTPSAAAGPLGTTCRTVDTTDTSQPVPQGFQKGEGFLQSYCEYERAGVHIRDASEAARALSPINTPRKALAMIVMLKALAFEPHIGPKTVPARVPKNPALQSEIQAFSFEMRNGGYLVSVPIRHSCPTIVYRQTFRVTTAGEVCATAIPTVLLDVGTGGCAD
jgi:hypothetical protein